ncbi:MAG: hypothetical protein UX49_C0003G0026 [Candidatus Wolfebacteria bacterium GW2011_GWC2_46_275]|uniref:Uncharacterized protein n=1 Tax=Candidatus Wolfebacteria bacterium GW2011_GWA2_47_9b TaxID=1619005 RepID=A0A0G1X769_9BACT|nr:MAG: hypothetical protein UX49_C0003G0026 [Candidatus Wolfebacteria bacterium GW2011_GWC2_46_275]KKU42611.1 MAG: hypothetical protein UX58_C0001G0043 [Candidatus Wolfebacteria bacterium GW2011_GWB2_46_69]KKU54654.1 MAG: hypothetical protein UX76_C0001G0113 [Candidatus Wolfebacteria bacterium GW2011_GWC1_47_103]KKU59175.1 MAG: hypothetical protein UX83_C0007G0023 [Candidatus Wolfebacteria bacterium GW2011_GWE2_47_12]KKU66446.1 MAG: hypothetical protein UX90_C0001G0505 [Candidatus Wolfebacteri
MDNRAAVVIYCLHEHAKIYHRINRWDLLRDGHLVSTHDIRVRTACAC